MTTMKKVTYVLCTNSRDLSDHLLKLCSKYHVFISTSLDGPEHVHNHNRGKSDSYQRVIAGIQKARDYLGIERVSALMTTSEYSLDYPQEIVKGTKKCKQAYLWCRLTGIGPPMIAFHFSLSQSRDVAESLLGDYSGTIIRDSYATYEKLDCEVACYWAHVRKRLLQAAENGYTKAEPLLNLSE